MNQSVKILSAHWLDVPKPTKVVGVYFLLLGSDVVYIGASTNIPARVSAHRSRIEFDDVKWIPCAESDLDDLEGSLIIHFTPEHNVHAPVVRCPRPPAWLGLPMDQWEIGRETMRQRREESDGLSNNGVMYLRVQTTLKAALMSAHATYLANHSMDPRISFAEFVGRMLAQAIKDEMWPT